MRNAVRQTHEADDPGVLFERWRGRGGEVDSGGVHVPILRGSGALGIPQHHKNIRHPSVPPAYSMRKVPNQRAPGAISLRSPGP